jgi:DNA-binding transcriptional regulator YiaG
MTSPEPANEEKFENLDPQSVRNKAGLSLTEMADLIGMSEAGYNAWEKGTRRPGGPAYKLLFLLDNNPKDIVAQLSRLMIDTGIVDT